MYLLAVTPYSFPPSSAGQPLICFIFLYICLFSYIIYSYKNFLNWFSKDFHLEIAVINKAYFLVSGVTNSIATKCNYVR